MKKILVGILLFSLLVVGVKGVALYKKFRHSNRLKVRVRKFKLMNLSSEIDSNIVLEIGNFSKSTFKINQVSFEVFTQSGEILARQKAPLQNPITLQPNQNNIIPIAFTINRYVALSELKKIGGTSSVIANFLTDGKHNLKLNLKGFVVAENIKININQTLNV